MDNLGNIKITRVETIQEFESLREQWTSLLFQCPEKDIFLTWEWLFAWWKWLGQPEHQLWILLFHDDERLIGIAPLMLSLKRKYGVNLNWLENIGNPECDVSTFISIEPEKTTKAFLRYLREKQREWDVLELKQVNMSNTGNQRFIAILDSSPYGIIRTTQNHLYIPLIGDNWEAYYSRLSKNMKHNLKRRMKRLSEMGPVTIQKYSGESLTWEQFQVMLAVSEKSNFPDLYKSANLFSFHKELLTFTKEFKWVQIEMLFVGDRPIAFQYGFCFNNRYEDWRGGIDKEFEILAPGKLLMMFSLEDRFKCGIEENDFLRGVYSYKLDWNPQGREFTSTQIYNTDNLKPKLVYWGLIYVKPWIKFFFDKVKRKPKKENQDSP